MFGFPEQMFGTMEAFRSSADVYFDGDAIHLVKWKTGEEMNFTFLSENPRFVRKLMIGKKACYGSELKKIQMPIQTEISRSSFAFSFLLTDVVFSPFAEVFCIADKAFYSCIGLQRFCLPTSVCFLGRECFSHCVNLNAIDIESGSRLSRIEERAFYLSGLREICLPRSVEYLGDFCFNESYYLSKVDIEAGSQLNVIGSKCFRGTGIKYFEIPENIEKIGEKAFDCCRFFVKVIFGGCS
jgi:hypothetical protein